MMRGKVRLIVLLLLVQIVAVRWSRADEIDDALTTITDVGREGAGNEAAKSAWNVLAAADAEVLPRLLAGIDDSSPVAANYVRSAIDAVAERTLESSDALPLDDLEAFLADRENAPRARRLAFELIRDAEEERAAELVPGFLDDPSVELRREAVAGVIDEAEEELESGDAEAATTLYSKALDPARDLDQVEEISEELQELGKTVDLPKHFGFIMNWKLVSSFDNEGEAGFDVVYPPEREVDFDATYVDKLGREVTWQDYTSTDEYGIVDLNRFWERTDDNRSHKGAIAYAAAVFESDDVQNVEFRLGCKNAWKLWLNGELLFAREEYHRGMRMDQYRIPGTLKPGKNLILLKICQNEQTQSWAQEWEFQLRVCDTTGTAILSEDRPETPEEALRKAK